MDRHVSSDNCAVGQASAFHFHGLARDGLGRVDFVIGVSRRAMALCLWSNYTSWRPPRNPESERLVVDTEVPSRLGIHQW